MRYAGFWRRYVAYGIDASIVQVIAFVAIWMLGSVAHAQAVDPNVQQLIDLGWLNPGDQDSVASILQANGASGSGGLFSMGDLFIMTMISGIYNIWFTAGTWQATPGKHWCKLTTIRTNGMAIGLRMSAVRWFASGVSWLPLMGGYFMVAFTREKVAMHDVICGTRVVYRDSVASPR